MDNNTNRHPRDPVEIPARRITEVAKRVGAKGLPPNQRKLQPTTEAPGHVLIRSLTGRITPIPLVGQIPTKLISLSSPPRRAELSPNETPSASTKTEKVHMANAQKAEIGLDEPADTKTTPPSALLRPRLIDFNETKARTSFGRSFLYQKIASGEFPRPVKLGIGRRAPIRFVEAEVDDWIAQRIAERDAKCEAKPNEPRPTQRVPKEHVHVKPSKKQCR